MLLFPLVKNKSYSVIKVAQSKSTDSIKLESTYNNFAVTKSNVIPYSSHKKTIGTFFTVLDQTIQSEFGIFTSLRKYTP